MARNKKHKKERISKGDVKIGRKKKNDESIRCHNKYTTDNVMNKIKNVIKKYLIIFINNVINKLYDQKHILSILNKLDLPVSRSLPLIKDIDYKSLANKTKKNDNLKILNFSLKEFLSQNISMRYKSINKGFNNFNKKVIELLFKDEKNKDIFNFVFNQLKFEDWLNIFIRQKELKDFPSFNSLDSNQAHIIEESLIRIEEVLNELCLEDDIYFFCFILLLYNYKRYFLVKQGRKSKKSNIIID